MPGGSPELGKGNSGWVPSTSVCKIALNLAASVKLRFVSTILSLDKQCFLPLFANVSKNKITSLETHIIVCLSETG